MWYVVEEMLVWLVEELDEGIASGFPMEFFVRSGNTSHNVSHLCSISAMSFCRSTWKEEMVKEIEALTDQRVGSSVVSIGLWIGSLQ